MIFYRPEYTHLVGSLAPNTVTHAATLVRGQWASICSRWFEPEKVLHIEARDDLQPTCKLCQRVLRPHTR